MGFFDFIGDAVKDVTSVVTAPISAITNAVAGGAKQVIAPIAKTVAGVRRNQNGYKPAKRNFWSCARPWSRR